MAAPGPEATPEYDLIQKMAPFLDRHFLFPMFHWLRETEMYPRKDVIRAEIKLLNETKLLDLLSEKLVEVGDEVPDDLPKRKEQIMEVLSDERNRAYPLLEILEDEDKVKKLSGMKSIAEMCHEFDLDNNIIDYVLRYSKFQYDCGFYEFPVGLMKPMAHLLQDGEALSVSRQASCKWGVLACTVLLGEVKESTNVIVELDEFVESSRLSKKETLMQRAWLLHWTLFVMFREKSPDTKLCDILLNEKNLVIISLAAPHLFRYVAASLILQKWLKPRIKDVVKTMHQEASTYSDPIVRFLLALYNDIDFDQAQAELQESARVCKSDYFLAAHWAEFEENARLLIFEAYCRIHQCINIGMIASKLNMKEEEAELWIVKLIQSAKLDARIDSEKSRVVMSKAPPSVYQQVIEKTKNLSFRSTMLLSNLESSEKERDRIAAGAA